MIIVSLNRSKVEVLFRKVEYFHFRIFLGFWKESWCGIQFCPDHYIAPTTKIFFVRQKMVRIIMPRRYRLPKSRTDTTSALAISMRRLLCDKKNIPNSLLRTADRPQEDLGCRCRSTHHLSLTSSTIFPTNQINQLRYC